MPTAQVKLTPMPDASPTPRRASLWSRLAGWFGRGARFPSDATGAHSAAASTPALAPPTPASTAPPAQAGAAATAKPAASPAVRELPKLTDYTLQQVVARTERRTVYRATETRSGRVIALKTVTLAPGTPPADRALWRERFLHEAEAASRLRHPDIVRVRAGGVQGEGDAMTGWLALEWVPGADLSRYASPTRLLPERLALGIAARVALALHHAHQAGIIHRDIKPGNVMFDPASGSVKVTDFGSARVADLQATRSGMIVGTPAYMAPEQLAGAEATPQSDLYSVGVMLFELLTGGRPFDAPSMGDLLARIGRQPAPHVRESRPDLPPLIDDIVQRLLAKTPDERHRDGRQLALELQVAQAHLAVTPPAPPPRSAAVTTAPLSDDTDQADDWDEAVDPFAPTMPPPFDDVPPLAPGLVNAPDRTGVQSEAQSAGSVTPPKVPSSSPSS